MAGLGTPRIIVDLTGRLYPLGEAEGGLCFLAIGENDRVYILMMSEIRLLGGNIDEALEALLIGIQSSPVVTP